MSVTALSVQVGMCMGLTPDDLQELLAVFEQSSWQEMTVSVAGDTLHVSRRDGAAGAGRPADIAPVPAAAPAAAPDPPPVPPGAPQPDPVPVPGASAVPAPPEAHGIPVAAPSVGLFWRAPSPGAPPFVEVGTRVGPEDVVGIVEVMKLMNRVTAGTSGVVTAVLVENGGMVEHGQPLVLIDPSA
jgi:acetyl-CoA carboxylase biotin carboxyl carrier protein